jgi:hypothetical protein
MVTGEWQRTEHDRIISHHLGDDLLVQRNLLTPDPAGPWTRAGRGRDLITIGALLDQEKLPGG